MDMWYACFRLNIVGYARLSSMVVVWTSQTSFAKWQGPQIVNRIEPDSVDLSYHISPNLQKLANLEWITPPQLNQTRGHYCTDITDITTLDRDSPVHVWEGQPRIARWHQARQRKHRRWRRGESDHLEMKIRHVEKNPGKWPTKSNGNTMWQNMQNEI